MTESNATPSDTTTLQWRVGHAPGRLPLLGHAVPLRRRPLEFLTSLNSVGDLVELQLGHRSAYMVTHPRLIHQVLADPVLYD